MTHSKRAHLIRRQIESLDNLAHEFEYGNPLTDAHERLIVIGETLQSLGEEFISTPLLPSESPSAPTL
jgi:hypothetical protein